MKKLMFFLAVILFAAQVDSQVLRLDKNQTYESYTGVAGDTAKSTTAKTFDIFVNKTGMYYYDVQASLDSAGDGTNFTCQLQGSNDETNFYNVGDAQTWYVSSTDTVLRFTNMTSVSTSATIAAATDYHAYDTSAGGSSIIADTVTIGARTITETLTEPSVGWRYLRLSLTGAGANAKCELELLSVAIRPKLFTF